MTGNPSPEDRKRALLEAAQAAAEETGKRGTQAGSRPPRREGSSPVSLGLAALASGFGIYMLVARPAWFLTPPPPPEPPALQEAALRLSLVREASRIEQFRATSGRLPATLEEAGSTVSGIVYQPADGTVYVIRAVTGRDTLSFVPGQPLEGFLGSSLERVLARGRNEP